MALSILNRLTKSSGSIQRTLRYIEWTILGVLGVWVLTTPPADYQSPKIFVLLLLVAWGALSLIFPVNDSQWQRRIYVGAELGLFVVMRWGNWGSDILLYLIFAKSCFLLNRRESFIVMIVGGFVWMVPLVWIIPQNIEYAQQHMHEIFAPSHRSGLITSRLINEILSFISASTFVFLMSFLIVNEQKSQQKIKTLNQEVETLGTALERTRIARNIHDTLGHTLTALGIQLEVAQQICLSQPEKTSQRLATAKHLADQCLQDIRSVVQALRHSDFDLTSGLVGLMTHLKQTQPLATQVQLNLPPLPLQTSYQLYCIIQEGITNIQKHAQASEVSLRSQVNAESLILELSDNGKGFDLSQSTTGFGLQGMYERSQLTGAMLKVQSASGQGTQLRITLPYHPAEP